ncbi:hypothetical protein E2C01_046650 [Portunus trituberculatus]|uniref:Uncharacterized protein n=1 Tax=Portunus trituberculatus TaxID=210409 RepID=A0A5B7G1J1_PORTR|nr:hypothetical protein [Portunus trituberculatus]
MVEGGVNCVVCFSPRKTAISPFGVSGGYLPRTTNGRIAYYIAGISQRQRQVTKQRTIREQDVGGSSGGGEGGGKEWNRMGRVVASTHALPLLEPTPAYKYERCFCISS